MGMPSKGRFPLLIPRSGIPGGKPIRFESGDVVVIPAGVSHSMAEPSGDILVVSGYAEGRDRDDMREDHIDEAARRAADKRVMMLPIPSRDPVTAAAMTE